MCTVTWTRDSGGYLLLFNRDERKTRKPADPPSVQSCRGVPFLAPRDGDAGGTWIAVNQRGLTLALLNHYPAEAAAGPGRTSRGLLVASLMDTADVKALAGRLEPRALADFRPFFLVALDPASPAKLHTWDGAKLETRAVPDDAVPVSTSSFESDAVVNRRRARFAEMRSEQGRVDGELLFRYHTSREEGSDAYSVFMRRPDAETVSLSRVRVGPDRIDFSYWPRAEIENGAGDAAPLSILRA
ncbi:MAG TPA: NRDE family protein [Kiritimatiellia bacterium]|jgi:uncharacterized protein with NRDE domain